MGDTPALVFARPGELTRGTRVMGAAGVSRTRSEEMKKK
jgi:hypothetical protein